MPLEIISRHKMDKKVSQISQHGFTNGKPCMTNLIISYHKKTVPVDKGKIVKKFHIVVKLWNR